MSEKCTDCSHYEVCDYKDSSLLHCNLHYEPKRVKCKYGCVKTRIVADENTGCHAIVHNAYCPKCGTRIEVK